MILQPQQQVGVLSPDTENRFEQSKVTVSADAGAYEVATLTADTGANSVQADFFVITNVAGTTYGVWLDIDANGTAPDGAIYVATDNKIEVDITSSDTAAQVGTKIYTAINGNVTNVSFVDNLDGTITITQTKIGVVADLAVYDETEGGSSSLTAATNTSGVASSLQNKYFQVRDGDGNNFFPWFNVGSEGSEPAGSGTAIAVAISAGATAASVASALASAIDANGSFQSEVLVSSGSVISIAPTDTAANVTDIVDVDTSFTFQVVHQGQAEIFSPSFSTNSLTNSPSLIS